LIRYLDGEGNDNGDAGLKRDGSADIIGYLATLKQLHSQRSTGKLLRDRSPWNGAPARSSGKVRPEAKPPARAR